jgi:glycosyltransferase involved in cell wall biosynthesis
MARLLFHVNRPEFFLSHRLGLALAARDAGYDVHVATPFNEHVDAIRATGLPWHEIRLAPGGTNVLGELRTLWSVIRCYRTVRPDLVHQITVKPVLYGTLAARLTGVGATVNAMPGLGLGFGAARPLVKAVVRIGFSFVLRHPRMMCIFQNDADRELFVARRFIRAEQSIVIRGSGVDPSQFIRGRTDGGLPLVMFASRLLMSKGVREFIEASRTLSGRARFVVVGGLDRHNPDSATAADLERWREEGVVELWGHRDDMAAVLAQATIFCLPTYLPEGVPKVLLEAASARLAIVTTDRPGCRDVVIDGETGLLVPERDANALVVAIQRLLDDPTLRERLGRHARERVIENFTIDRVIAQTLEVYGKLLARVDSSSHP